MVIGGPSGRLLRFGISTMADSPSYPRRGDLWMVNFEPSVGTEIQKVRPALILSNDIANERTTKVTLVPLTGTVRSLSIVVVVQPTPENGLDRPSTIRVPDVTTFDKRRLHRRLGGLSTSEMAQVEESLRQHLML